MVNFGEKQMKQVKKIAGVIAAGAILFAGTAVAEGRQDFYTQADQLGYFFTPENARTVGMAGSSVATSSDSSSVVGNPAGLGFMRDADVSVTYGRNTISGNDDDTGAEVEAELDQGQALAAIPIVPTLDGTPKYGTLGFGWTGMRGDADTAVDNEFRNYSLNLAYGKDLSDKMAVGYAFAYNQAKASIQSGLDAASRKMEDGVRQEIGMQYKASKNLTYGASTHYGFGSYDYEGDFAGTGASLGSEDVDNWGMDVGAGYTSGKTLWTGSVDYNRFGSDVFDDYGLWNFRVGLEHSLTDMFKGRLGYRYAAFIGNDLGYGNDNVKFNAVSLGLGVKLAKFLNADYATEYRSVGDGSDWFHTVTLSVPFSLCNN
jgi:hypothetical protein